MADNGSKTTPPRKTKSASPSSLKNTAGSPTPRASPTSAPCRTRHGSRSSASGSRQASTPSLPATSSGSLGGAGGRLDVTVSFPYGFFFFAGRERYF